MRQASAERPEGGFALILVLWSVALLGLIAASFATGVRSNALIARNAVENAAARALADGGVALAIAGLLEQDGPNAWRPDGTPRSLEMQTGRIRIAVVDEGGKIDINAETGPLIADLLHWLGLAPPDALALSGAIAGFGASGGGDRTPPGAPRFASVAELLHVPGMTSPLFARIEPFVTVHSGESTLNIQTAPRALIEALTGADPAAIEAFVATRLDRDAGPEDIPPGPLAGEDRFDVSNVRVVTVISRGETPGGGRFQREAIVALEPATRREAEFRILSWTQRFD